MTISIITLWFAIIFLYCIMATWKLFEKAGRPSWEGFVPLYNIYIWLKVIKRPWWWAIILLIPGFSQILMFMAMNVSMGRMFGKFSVKDTLMQIFVPFIYFPMLAFGKEELVFEGETNWEDDNQVERRKISDQIALFLSSFGIVSVIANMQIMTGSKRKKGGKSIIKEWGDSIVFALIAASLIRGYVLEAFTIPTPSMEKELLVGDFLFVNKLSYGTRVPFTPLSYPLVHNTIPFTYKNSYSEVIKLPYYRLPGFGKVKRNDIVVFNHPVGDTAIYGRYPGSVGAGGELQGHNYYQFIRSEAFSIGREQVKSEAEFFKNKYYFESIARDNILNKKKLYGFDIHGYTHRPIDKKENYIKRCVAIPGDTLQIINSKLYIDGKRNIVGENVNFDHYVTFNRAIGKLEIDKFKEKFGFNTGQYKDLKAVNDESQLPNSPNCIINMSEKVKEELMNSVKSGEFRGLEILSVEKRVDTIKNKLNAYQNFYPNHEYFPWNVDNYGPLWMPAKGATIDLTPENWALYSRCIITYENNQAEVKNGAVYLNGKKADTYTFKQGYYYMVGDNRHNSADSRMWGFVPQDHIVGKGLIIWMSKDQEKGWTDGGVRWNRIFKTL